MPTTGPSAAHWVAGARPRTLPAAISPVLAGTGVAVYDDAADWWKTADDGDQLVTVKKATEVIHQEHSAIPLAPGNYRVRRQREYQPAGIVNVQD